MGTAPREELAAEWHELLRAHAADYVRVAIENIGREFPSHLVHLMTRPGDFPRRPADRSPVFYGSLDWHSCVEMHWVLVRLLRLVPDAIPASEVRAVLGRQLDAAKLATEAEFVASDDGRHERPYGWAWALALAFELGVLAGQQGDADAARWLAAMAPLEAAVVAGLTDWLPKATYPIRYGVHQNSAFAFATLLPYARERAPELAVAVSSRALAWFGDDLAYPAEFEPSGHDFLSPALTEAVLMSQLLQPAEFPSWLELFLPALNVSQPRGLFAPVVVSDPNEGQIAHLHGLNASRAWCWRQLAETLPPGDPRVGPALAAARTHLDAALPHVTGSDYMVEHWLAAYAVLALS
ncbi:MAG TPA: DUF2891 domain-containing protein [Streptosporangiaceae bacterium]|nr:DUF2891 domain-containing protein [Streptosporangiaceae bacterium]